MGEDIEVKYGGQLAHLRINSKPLINMLTMLAEDFIRHAPTVVQVIEKHLSTVKPELKLPVLYLIDSIIKNVKKDYVELFTQNIVSTFCGVFEKVDEKTRGLLWKLRGTWNDHFPPKKLYGIDVRCQQVDPKWPIMAPTPATGSIHVNPRFLGRNASATLLKQEQIAVPAVVPIVASTTSGDEPDVEVQMRAQLLAKQKELLELQTKRIELELMETKLQIEEKARKQKEEAAKKIDVAVKQERLAGMAEMAKNRTEKIQQQLSTLHRPTSGSGVAVASSIKGSPSSSKSRDTSSDRDSHHSSSSKVSKATSETSGSSVDENSKKSKSSRDKSDRDRRDRGKSDKGKGRHDSKDKDKESRHKHRDKDRHGESKDKNRERNKDSVSTNKIGGEWKDYNEAKKVSSKRTHQNSTGMDSGEEPDLHLKDSPHKRTPSPLLASVSPKSTGGSKHREGSAENNFNNRVVNPSKSPSSSSQQTDSFGSGSPVKRRFAKDRQSDKDRKENDKPKENNDKFVLSDPRLRRRNTKATEEKAEENCEPPAKSNEWSSKDYTERRQAVLKRNYRKNTGIDIKDDPELLPLLNAEMGPGDVDLRFDSHMDVDLRPESADGSGPEPPVKKSRPEDRSGTFDDLFGHQDVDLRPGSSCWTQVKVKSENVEQGNLQDKKIDVKRTERDSSPTQILRSPGPASPSIRSTCDPLGRPLVYDRLPNDPEERKRSLDSRSSSVDPVEQFRIQHIDRALQGTGALSDGDVTAIIAKAMTEHEQGSLSREQCVAIIDQIRQVNETNAIRKVQQMQQMKPATWQQPDTPNPWMKENDENNIWGGFGSAGPRFTGPNSWESTATTLPWISGNTPSAPQGPNPFEVPVVADDAIPAANKNDLRLAERDNAPSIPIDKDMRQIRFYGEISVVLMGMMNDDPRELTFQMDDRPRTVLINGKPLKVCLGESKKFVINGLPHTLRIGTPGRELYVDDRPYEMFFGGRPSKVLIDKRWHTFQLLPPTPQVSVGPVPRYDLLAGRVNLAVDAVHNVSVFLDEKLQKIEIGGEPVILKFGNGFQTVTLNGRPFPTNFGAKLPFTITLPGTNMFPAQKHYLRFFKLSPNAERAVKIFIAASSGEWNDARTNHFGGRGRGNQTRGRGRGRPQHRDAPLGMPAPGPNPWMSEIPQEAHDPVNMNPLDILNNFFPVQSDNMGKVNLDQSYESEQQSSLTTNIDDQEQTDSDAAPNLNVTDLVANLIKFGLLPAGQEASPVEPVQDKDAEEEKSSDENVNSKSDDEESEKKPKEKPKESKEEPKSTVPPLPTVDVAFTDNLKERRTVAVAQIFTGMQCSQCGLRFPPDQTSRYSQHLDWHFRQNRREKANARKALSRKWYYDLSDWIQFEEIEDLEERAASLFESQEMQHENDAKSPSATLNPEDFTVLASSYEGVMCPQCGESFETYFDEDLEEWRLKNAKVDECEGKLYHPICYEDYLKSLVEESVVEEDEIAEEEKVETIEETLPKAEEDDDEVLIIKEGKKEVVVMEIDIDDDDVEKTGSVNVHVNEESPSVEIEKTETNPNAPENLLKDGAKSCNDSPLDDTRDTFTQSPILIDEDSTFLPGISAEAEGGVFGFALNFGIQPERPSMEMEGKRIIYEPMKFDIPPIKIEPPDEEPTSQDAMNPDEFLSNLQPFLIASERSPGGSEPMNIDLTEEDSSDAVDSGARLVNQIRTSIDGNLQHEDAAPLPFIIASKIRINISGMDTNPSSSPVEKPESPKAQAPQQDSGDGQESKADGNENNIIPNDTKINKDIPVDPVLTEEIQRLKPRLVGKKLTNCPPRETGKEESGLCVIC